jgi:hypothetical protein
MIARKPPLRGQKYVEIMEGLSVTRARLNRFHGLATAILFGLQNASPREQNRSPQRHCAKHVAPPRLNDIFMRVFGVFCGFSISFVCATFACCVFEPFGECLRFFWRN